jgi:hypothetical protein
MAVWIFGPALRVIPTIPLQIYSDLSDDQKNIIMESWMNGWSDESLMPSLPNGMPA